MAPDIVHTPMTTSMTAMKLTTAEATSLSTIRETASFASGAGAGASASAPSTSTPSSGLREFMSSGASFVRAQQGPARHALPPCGRQARRVARAETRGRTRAAPAPTPPHDSIAASSRTAPPRPAALRGAPRGRLKSPLSVPPRANAARTRCGKPPRPRPLPPRRCPAQTAARAFCRFMVALRKARF